MQNIRVNNKIFNSIAKAAKFIGLKRSNLSTMLKDKQATTYKDLLIEKLDKPSQKKTRLRGKKVVPVIVDGQPYASCAEAERKLGLAACVISHALKRGKKSVCNHIIEPVYPSMIKPTNKTVKVVCVTTGVVYDKLGEAAKAANADQWTMSKKMETAGGYIDINGNEYRRLTPMKTKNKYTNTGKKLQKTPRGHTRTKKPLPDTAPETQTSIKQNVPQVVKDAINDKIIDLLKRAGVYDQIVDLLNYGGFSSIKINK